MVPSTVQMKADGSAEMTNLLIDQEGGLRRAEATMNAVVVQMVEGVDYEGKPAYSRVVWIMCKDADALPALQQEAQRIIREDR